MWLKRAVVAAALLLCMGQFQNATAQSLTSDDYLDYPPGYDALFTCKGSMSYTGGHNVRVVAMAAFDHGEGTWGIGYPVDSGYQPDSAEATSMWPLYHSNPGRYSCTVDYYLDGFYYTSIFLGWYIWT